MIGEEPMVQVARMVDAVPQWVVDYATGRGKNTDVGEWIVSLLPPEATPETLSSRLWALLKYEQDEYGCIMDEEAMAKQILVLVAGDIKENFGWETRITGYLRDQAK